MQLTNLMCKMCGLLSIDTNITQEELSEEIEKRYGLSISVTSNEEHTVWFVDVFDKDDISITGTEADSYSEALEKGINRAFGVIVGRIIK